MLLFVHTPKCAGVTVRNLLLESPATKDRVLLDYDWTFAQPLEDQLQEIASFSLEAKEIPKNSIVYGHYYPARYIGAGGEATKNIPLVTIIRHPLRRMQSHFHYFKDSDLVKIPLARKVRDEDWDFERFALGPELRNFMTRMMSGVSIDRFDFIGVQEEFKRSLQIINDRYDLDFDLSEIPEQNVGGYDRKTISRTTCSRKLNAIMCWIMRSMVRYCGGFNLYRKHISREVRFSLP